MSLQRISFAEACAFSRAGEGTFSGSNGLLQTAAAGVPRLDYDPVTLAPKGILIEGGRTNLLTYSDDFTNWTALTVGSSVTSNAVAAPDGTMTADKIIPSTTLGGNQWFRTFGSSVAGRFVTITFYAKAAEYRYLQCNGNSAAWGNEDYAVFDLLTGAVTQVGTNGTAAMQSVGGGWYRCTRILTEFGALGTANLYIGPCIIPAPGRAVQFSGDGTSGIYVWRANLKTGNFGSSDVATTTASITAAADILTVQPAQFAAAFRQDAGTILIDMTLNHTGLTATGANDFPFLLDMDSAAALTDGYRFIASAGYGPGYKIEVTTSGSPVAGPTFAKALGGGSRTKLALSWGGANDFAACMDGGAVVTDTSGAIPTPDRLSIGCQDGSGNQMFGHVREVLFFPNKFSAALLQEATTL